MTAENVNADVRRLALRPTLFRSSRPVDAAIAVRSSSATRWASRSQPHRSGAGGTELFTFSFGHFRPANSVKLDLLLGSPAIVYRARLLSGTSSVFSQATRCCHEDEIVDTTGVEVGFAQCLNQWTRAPLYSAIQNADRKDPLC